MRAQLAGILPGVQQLPGTAEAIPLAGASADALVCAQAFHWFATEPALAEIRRVLRPGGRLGLIWNVRDESVDWVATITEIIAPYEGDAPRFSKGAWRQAFSGQYFTELEQSSFAYQHVGTAQEVILDRFLSVSFIAALPPHEKANVANQLRALIASHPALRERDAIAFPYRTELIGAHAGNTVREGSTWIAFSSGCAALLDRSQLRGRRHRWPPPKTDG